MAVLFALICYLCRGVWVGIAKLKYWSSDDNLGITGVYCINTSEIPGELSREDNMLSSHVKRSPSLWLRNKSHLWKQADLVFHWCLYNKQNITYLLMDMNFIFKWSTRYLTSEHSGHVISSISLVCFYSCVRYSFPFGRPEGALKATLSLFERVRLQYIMFWI